MVAKKGRTVSMNQPGAKTADVKALGRRLEATITENTREIVGHFNASQAGQNKWISERFEKVDQRFEKVDQRFDEMAVELEAIKEMLAMRQELRNLVRELKTKGIALDESKIFSR